MKKLLASLVPLLAVTATLSAQTTIVNDSWADAGRTDGADPTDTGWWFSTSSSAIEVGAGFLGLVTGGSGRGIHGTFASQSLSVGDSLRATYTFTTPATVGSAGAAGLRIGFFDTTGKPGLTADLNSSSGSPNAIYNNLFGYMTDFDINTGTENIAFRERSNAGSGQLLATTADYTQLAAGGGAYSMLANTTYTGVLTITRTGAGSIDLTGTLFQGLTQLSTFTTSDATASTTTFGMLALHANSLMFGSSSTVNTADNGIDFTNIKVEYIAVPEPGILSLAGMGAMLLMYRRRR